MASAFSCLCNGIAMADHTRPKEESASIFTTEILALKLCSLSSTFTSHHETDIGCEYSRTAMCVSGGATLATIQFESKEIVSGPWP
ncbi:hypothetical protein AUEXF2481DRAFT_35421 [Aureobasidium subglaciale EXF-2481]|uniref:Uncharacterized protein n=1 Tax=Aureobasidium subglaciale (strain EXF-2481) TaxID=1043005 RepID=A0A074YTN0_AURSE|nr:uncharacterized protein AUEXF2481DRAFT_35421 [Aureobasidium subglaciale EXF-2481]KEQ99509.1 hypothetical protein AUEXF2481DRAFT_35421 [Aureobasidium subglaciale EXF-2481]